jgi:hypothetical protein
MARPVGVWPSRRTEVGVEPKDFPHEITIEEWILPDGSDFIELSFKVAPDQAVDAGKAFRDMLADRGLDTDGDQVAKTRRVLEFYTAAG